MAREKQIRSVAENNASNNSSVADGMPRKVTWPRLLLLLGGGAFVTSVTIASIPVPNDARNTVDMAAWSPPVTLLYSDKLPDILLEDILSENEPLSALVDTGSPGPPENELAEVRVRRGETLARILHGRGLHTPELLQVVQTDPEAQRLNRLIPGDRLFLRTAPDGSLLELVQAVDPAESFHFERGPNGFEVKRVQRDYEIRPSYVTGTIERSLFEDGLEAGLSEPLILAFAEIFGWDVDFALDLHPGDQFSVVFEEKYLQGQKVADGEILAAEFVNRGRSYRAIGFRSAEGIRSYFTPQGASLRRPFLRTPVKFSSVSSTFSNSRYHPILKTWRAHKGVDYAAPVGTPVQATASGRIVSIGVNGGYGNTIVVKHGAAYSTLYAHLSRFRAGLRLGQEVDQGDVLGYVGQTGLTTGPHLHYEFLVNGVHRDPLTFEFPAGNAVPALLGGEFQQQVSHWTSRLDLIGSARVARNERR